MKTLNEHSRDEILALSDEEFEAVAAHTVEQLIQYIDDTSAEWNERWRRENPEKAARLEQWKLDHPEQEAARRRGGEMIRAEARQAAYDCLVSGWADARERVKAGLDSGLPEERWCHETSAHAPHAWSESGRSFYCDGVKTEG